MPTQSKRVTAESARRTRGRTDYAPHVTPVADTMPEFCKRANIGRTTGFKLVKEGKVRAVNVPGIGLRIPEPEEQARALYEGA